MSNEYFTIKVDGKDKEIKMSFGLLNQLCGMCGDADDALMFGLNTDLREEALRLMLSKRDKEGRISDDVNLYLIDVDSDDVSDLLDWAGSHALDFFLKAATKTKAASEKHQEAMMALQPSSSGGKD